MEKTYILPSKTSKFHIWETYILEQDEMERTRDGIQKIINLENGIIGFEI